MQKEKSAVQVTEKRACKRFRQKRSIPYINMGEAGRYPEDTSGNIELLDLSNCGIRLRVEGLLPIEGAIVQIRIPINGKMIALPVFAQIRWAKKVRSKFYHVGLQFLI